MWFSVKSPILQTAPLRHKSSVNKQYQWTVEWTSISCHSFIHEYWLTSDWLLSSVLELVKKKSLWVSLTLNNFAHLSLPNLFVMTNYWRCGERKSELASSHDKEISTNSPNVARIFGGQSLSVTGKEEGFSDYWVSDSAWFWQPFLGVWILASWNDYFDQKYFFVIKMRIFEKKN